MVQSTSIFQLYLVKVGYEQRDDYLTSSDLDPGHFQMGFLTFKGREIGFS